MVINLQHEEQSDQESYENIKKLNQKYPGMFMDAEEWKKERLKINRLEENKRFSSSLR